MIPVLFVTALVGLALLTQAGIILVQKLYPAQGEAIDVAGTKLHIVDIGPKDASGPSVVLVHGASCNLEAMRQPLGDRLAARRRVILIDRPGHGWSTPAGRALATPAAQAQLVEEVLKKLGVGPVILVGHSWAGALVARMALDYPARVAALVMLAPVTYPWSGGAGWFNELVARPVIGPLLAYTITLPLGYFLLAPGARRVFLPQVMPDNFVAATATPLLLRPREFLANARDLVRLKQAVAEQAPRYASISAPTVVISGDADGTVSTGIHSIPFAQKVRGAKLIVMPGVGHMIQNAAPDLVVDEIEVLAGLKKVGVAATAANLTTIS